MRRKTILILCAVAGLLAAGCPKGDEHYKAARKAEDLQDFDTALQYYQKALASDPQNADYRIKVNQIRFEAGAFHIKKGQELREKGDLQAAAAEFQRAATIDASSSVAVQEFRNTVDQLNDIARKQDEAAAGPNNAAESDLASGPPELKPLPETSVSLKMVNDVKIIYDTIGKQCGINVIYDPDFPARRISVELNNVTLQQALDIVAIQSKTFWKPVTENIIFVAQDTTQKHKDYDEQMVETFYLSNTIQSQDLTEIANGLRQVLNLTKVQQLNSQNAIIVRDTPDKLAIARRLLKDIDKAKPEVIIQVEVLSASTDRLRDIGVLPGQTASIAFTPPGSTVSNGSSSGSSNGSGSSTTTGAPLKGFSFSAGDYTITLPGATANFLLTDTTSKIIQNPEIRSIDGQPAKLNIGSRVPIATGSFQAGVGVGTTSVNPLVNTQFTYIDVGVNVNITPRIHPNHEVSLKVALEVSQVTSFQTIGGIQQPVIGQNKIEHDIRLREGEASILGGLFSKTDSKTVNGWPGFAQIPLMKYLFSDNRTDRSENDILIVLIPRIVRLPDWSRTDLRPISSGVEQNITTRRQSDIRSPETPKAPAAQPPAQQQAPAQPVPGVAPPAAQPQPGTPEAAASGQGARLRFDPQALTLAPGQTATLGIAVDNVSDLYSIPMMLQYDPAVISIEDIQHGTFLSSGNQEIAIVQGGDKSKGQVMIAATRQPNTPGVSGSGTLLGVVIKAIGPGATNLSIVQVNAKDSQQKPLALVTTEASVQVQPQ
ncbi:MAG TPA: cohesin domain-containing protein [Candidatus Eisenbacteria bacterium]|jgi:general secretion pathway protein D|nr:cohesin domain-containing protein [Candidatus Eisenbacteria bacterium]